MNTILSNFKAFSKTTEIETPRNSMFVGCGGDYILPTKLFLVVSPNNIIKSFIALILVIITGVTYYYKDTIIAVLNGIIGKLLLKMHVNSMGQLASSYVPTST